MRRTALALAAVACSMALAVPADAALRACKPVRDPYPGTRYAGVDLTRIRGLHMTCPATRRVARLAHRRALTVRSNASGFRRFTWRGWRVTGDLRPASDRYIARKGDRRVRWRF